MKMTLRGAEQAAFARVLACVETLDCCILTLLYSPPARSVSWALHSQHHLQHYHHHHRCCRCHPRHHRAVCLARATYLSIYLYTHLVGYLSSHSSAWDLFIRMMEETGRLGEARWVEEGLLNQTDDFVSVWEKKEHGWRRRMSTSWVPWCRVTGLPITHLEAQLPRDCTIEQPDGVHAAT